jgi:hypothetical protein
MREGWRGSGRDGDIWTPVGAHDGRKVRVPEGLVHGAVDGVRVWDTKEGVVGEDLGPCQYSPAVPAQECPVLVPDEGILRIVWSLWASPCVCYLYLCQHLCAATFCAADFSQSLTPFLS